MTFLFSHCGSSCFLFFVVFFLLAGLLRHSVCVDLPVFPLWIFLFCFFVRLASSLRLRGSSFFIFCIFLFFFCASCFVTPSTWIFPFSHCGSSLFFWCVWLRHSVCVDLPIFPLWTFLFPFFGVVFFLLAGLLRHSVCVDLPVFPLWIFLFFVFFFCASCFVTPSTWIFPFSHCGPSFLFCASGFVTPSTWIFPFSHCGSSFFFVRLASSLRLRGSSHFPIVHLPFFFLCVWLCHSVYVDLSIFPLWIFLFFVFFFFVRLASSLRLRGSSHFPIVDLPFLFWCVWLRHSVYVDLPIFPLWISLHFFVRLASLLRLRGSSCFPIVDLPVFLFVSFCASGFVTPSTWIFPFSHCGSSFLFWCVLLRHSVYVDLPIFPLWIFLFFYVCLASSLRLRGSFHFPIVDLFCLFVRLASSLRLRGSSHFPIINLSSVFFFCASGFVTPSTWIFPFSDCGSSSFFCASCFVTPSAWIFPFSHCGSSSFFVRLASSARFSLLFLWILGKWRSLQGEPPVN